MRSLASSGAVGVLSVRASADTRDVVVGDSIKLTVDWTGDGNLEFFEAPDLGLFDAFRGFQVYGSAEEKSLDRRRVVYDLVTDTPIGKSQVAEWFSTRDGRIASIRVHFDARPFAAMFGAFVPPATLLG